MDRVRCCTARIATLLDEFTFARRYDGRFAPNQSDPFRDRTSQTVELASKGKDDLGLEAAIDTRQGLSTDPQAVVSRVGFRVGTGQSAPPGSDGLPSRPRITSSNHIP